MSTATFVELGVPANIRHALESRGITSPFDIQAATIADAMAGHDVCGRAPTGSGKTLAFGIPLVTSVSRARPHFPRGLIMAPTRELAQQIFSELRSFAGKVRVGVVYGGVGYGPQLKALRNGVDILVACPGRLEDLVQQGAVNLRDVDRVVLDEADRMADMGFMPAVCRLLDQTAKLRQTLLFSATLDGDVAKLTREYQNDPINHQVGDATPDITAATHLFWMVDKTNRVALAGDVVSAAWPAIIFCRTRHGADRLTKQLSRSNVRAVAIHGGRSQNQRTRALADFSNGRVHALVATDVAARGIHVDQVASVVHFDPPEDAKAYLHRSGRTARAGHTGMVISFVQPGQQKSARQLQRMLGLDEPVASPDLNVVHKLAISDTTRAVPSSRDRDQKNHPEQPFNTDRPGKNRTHGKNHAGGKRQKTNRSKGDTRTHQSGPKRKHKTKSANTDPQRGSSSSSSRGGQTHSGQKRKPSGQNRKASGPRAGTPNRTGKKHQSRRRTPNNNRSRAA